MFLIAIRLNLRNDLLYFRYRYFLLCAKPTLKPGSSVNPLEPNVQKWLAILSKSCRKC